ncbi:hypothetical protein OAO01_08435, partial [Oligoflexia bacterium]|nr:hypothetical protein [Oligoflexia bacterium]
KKREGSVKICRPFAWAVLVVGLLLLSQTLYAEPKATYKFSGLEHEKQSFISYSDTIKLSTEQEQVKRKALSSISSPCCEKHTAYNCCGCEVAQSIVGLSNYLIAQHNYNAELVGVTVDRWITLQGGRSHSCDRADRKECCEEKEPESCELTQLEEIVETCRIPGSGG